VLARPGEIAVASESAVGDVAGQFEVRMGGRGQTAGSIADVEVVADEAGAFSFDGLEVAQAPFSVYAGATGLEPVRLDDVPLGGSLLLVELPVSAALVLSVVDAESGEPIADARVEAHRPSGSRDRGRRPIDARCDPASLAAAGLAAPYTGVFLLSPAGSKSNGATVSAPGHATQPFDLPGVAPGARTFVTIKLSRELLVAGRVLDAQREPIADAAVALDGPDPKITTKWPLDPAPELGRTRSDPDGRFVFDGLAAGEMVVRARVPGFVPLKRTLTLAAGSPLADLELVLQPAGQIAGVVLLGGQPAPGAHVRAVSVAQIEAVRAAERANGGSIAMKDRPPLDEHKAVADDRGHFVFENLAPEAYEVTGAPGALVIATVKPGETTEITLVGRNVPIIRGRVTDANGPVAGATVDAELYFAQMQGWLNGFNDTRTDADGNFELRVHTEGRYKVGADLGKLRSKGVELDLAWDQVQWVELQLPAAPEPPK
jgi:protocatechuate 3,4-dioxygenase beta subunit